MTNDDVASKLNASVMSTAAAPRAPLSPRPPPTARARTPDAPGRTSPRAPAAAAASSCSREYPAQNAPDTPLLRRARRVARVKRDSLHARRALDAEVNLPREAAVVLPVGDAVRDERQAGDVELLEERPHRVRAREREREIQILVDDVFVEESQRLPPEVLRALDLEPQVRDEVRRGRRRPREREVPGRRRRRLRDGFQELRGGAAGLQNRLRDFPDVDDPSLVVHLHERRPSQPASAAISVAATTPVPREPAGDGPERATLDDERHARGGVRGETRGETLAHRRPPDDRIARVGEVLPRDGVRARGDDLLGVPSDAAVVPPQAGDERARVRLAVRRGDLRGKRSDRRRAAAAAAAVRRRQPFPAQHTHDEVLDQTRWPGEVREQQRGPQQRHPARRRVEPHPPPDE
eukprot:30978-Pelagococcus_subviridis.AAC.6